MVIKIGLKEELPAGSSIEFGSGISTAIAYEGRDETVGGRIGEDFGVFPLRRRGCEDGGEEPNGLYRGESLITMALD
jgi:hypothetical protein